MSAQFYDVIVVGGGPGGSAAGTFLAKAGKKVLLLEKEKFPRFHIGESLLPYNRRIFEEMGVLPALEKAGFIQKLGAQFHLGNGMKKIEFFFRNGRFTKEPAAFQVERSKFDHLLLQHTARSGAEVREEWALTQFSESDAGVQVEAKSSSGEKASFQTRWLVDASGRGNVTGNLQGLREVHPRLKKLSVFGHFKGVELDPGEKGGDTVIVRLENQWFWVIPLSPTKVSVGLVMEAGEFKQLSKTPEEVFKMFVEKSSVMQRRLARATLDGPMHITSDFSYKNRRLIGQRLLRVGDAAGFMDPIFSSGVFLAMHSGKLAAEAVVKADANPSAKERLLKKYEQRVRHGMEFYWELVENFYTTPFMELLLEPREKWNLFSAVNAVLAGEVEGAWPIRWRLRLFFLLVKWQARRPLVPKIESFQ